MLEGLEEAVEDEIVPDSLGEIASPDAEDTEGVSPTSNRDEL